MSLYDIIDDISAHSVTKTETGDERIMGVMLGIVAVNYHKDMPGRICVTIPTRDGGANELKWARLVQPSGGDGWGHYFLPEVGDQVLLAFEGGNIERPYVIGSVLTDASKFLKAAVDADNQFKWIQTKHGTHITFEDNKNDEKGAKDKLTIETAAKRHTIVIDNENEQISLTESGKENSIILKTAAGSGQLQVTIKSSVQIKVGDKITVDMNGQSGVVKIAADQISLEATQKVAAKSDGSMNLEATNVTAKASSLFKAESGGVVTVTGNPIKIG